MMVLLDLHGLTWSADSSWSAFQALQQAANDLLDSKDLQPLLVLLLALCTRQLHKMQHGKPAAALLAAPAPTDASSSRSSSSSSSSRQQQRQRQQQQQQEQQLLLVPASHVQLLERFGITEQSLAGGLLDAAVARDPLPTHRSMLLAVQGLQLLLFGRLSCLAQQRCQAQRNSASRRAGFGSSSSSSSSRLAWPTAMLTAVLQTTIEAQVRSMQQPASSNCSFTGAAVKEVAWLVAPDTR
jgi:hypothetical protein